MSRRALRFSDSESGGLPALDYDPASLSLKKLEQYVHAWLLDCEIRMHSPKTLANIRY